MKYRKKPVVVNAEQFNSMTYKQSNFLEPIIRDKANLGAMWFNTTAADGRYYIDTLEGHMMVSEGDYVIEGVHGEFYPCKPDIFEETYSIADEEVELVYKHDAPGDTSDGSHTFDELYYHRMMLFAFICNSHKDDAWKSLQHDDGTMYDDYFIVGIDTPEGQFTYHYHVDHWDKFDVMMIDKAPKWDGHTSDDITRLNSLLSRF